MNNQWPGYSAEVWADWEEMKSDGFEENWPHVKRILATFETFGIAQPIAGADPDLVKPVYIADANLGNIKFE